MSDERLRVEVAQSRARCPFCHEEISAETPDWLACAHCLARHHSECWGETGRCGTCGRDEALGRVAPPKPKVRAAPSPIEIARRLDGAALVVTWVSVATLAALVGYLVAPTEALVLGVLALIVLALARLGKKPRRTR